MNQFLFDLTPMGKVNLAIQTIMPRHIKTNYFKILTDGKWEVFRMAVYTVYVASLILYSIFFTLTSICYRIGAINQRTALLCNTLDYTLANIEPGTKFKLSSLAGAKVKD